MDVGALLVLIVLPLSISIVAQWVLRGTRRSPTSKARSDESQATDAPARVLGTAGLGLLLKSTEVRRARRDRRLLDALATVGGSLLVKAPPDDEKYVNGDDGGRGPVVPAR